MNFTKRHLKILVFKCSLSISLYIIYYLNYFILILKLSLKWNFKCFFMKCVNLGLKVRLYPDEDMMIKINQNIGNSRFTWNKLLEGYKETYKLFKFHGYSKLKCNMTTFNAMLNML